MLFKLKWTPKKLTSGIKLPSPLIGRQSVFDFKDKDFFVAVNHNGDDVLYPTEDMPRTYNGRIDSFRSHARIHISLHSLNLTVPSVKTIS